MNNDTHQGMGCHGGWREGERGGPGKEGGDGINGNAPHGDNMGESPSVEILTFPSGGDRNRKGKGEWA